MADLDRIERLMLAKTSASARLFAKLIAAIRKRLPPPGSSDWYRDYAAVVGQLEGLARAAQRAQAAQTAKFTSEAMREFGDAVSPASVDVDQVRDGVDPVDVWQRPFEEYRYQVSQGVEPERAVELALQRAESIADLNLQRAATIGATETMKKSKSAKIVGYRRVIHPELSEGGSCGLCVAAATRLYKTSELAAIHARCKCESVPVYKGDADVANAMNLRDIRSVYSVPVFDIADLADLYADAGNTTDSAKLKYTRYQINEHGELGPVLTRKGDNFKADAEPDPRLSPEQARSERDAALAELGRMQKSGASQSEIAAQRAKIRRLALRASKSAA